MRAPLRWLPVALLVAGAGLVVHSAVVGATRVELVVIFPVLYSTSIEFGVGILLLFLGFLAFPFLFVAEEPDPEVRPVPGSSPGGGGVVLVGPVPIFFGSWKGASRAAYWAAALAGAGLLVGLLLLLVLL